MTHPALIERITRSLAYMLRHQPEEFDLEVDEFGFAEVDDVVRALNERLGEPVDEQDVQTAVTAGDRQRYEIQGQKIRALYGHSIEVQPGEPAKPPSQLFVGVSRQDADRASRFGLRAGRRRFLHLALTPDDAIESGRRAGVEYVVVTVHAMDAWEEGINFYDRRSLFLSDPIPTQYLELGEVFTDGIADEGRGREDRGGGDRPRGGRGGRGGHDRHAARGDAPRREMFRAAEPAHVHDDAHTDEPAEGELVHAEAEEGGQEAPSFGAEGRAPFQPDQGQGDRPARRRRGRRRGQGRGAEERRPEGAPFAAGGEDEAQAPRGEFREPAGQRFEPRDDRRGPIPAHTSEGSREPRRRDESYDRPRADAPFQGHNEPRHRDEGRGPRGDDARGPRHGGPAAGPRRDDRPMREEPRRDDRPMRDEGPRREDRPFRDAPPRRDDRPLRDEGPRRDDRPMRDDRPLRDEPRRDAGPRRDDRPMRDEGPRREERSFRDEGPRRDEPRREDRPYRDEGLRRDEPRRDEPRRDEPRRDEPRRDEPRRDEPRRDEPRRDEQRRDAGPRRDDRPMRDQGPRRDDRPMRDDGPRRDERPRDGGDRPFRDDRPQRSDRGPMDRPRGDRPQSDRQSSDRPQSDRQQSDRQQSDDRRPAPARSQADSGGDSFGGGVHEQQQREEPRRPSPPPPVREERKPREEKPRPAPSPADDSGFGAGV